MKIIVTVFIVLVSFCSCDPDNKDIFNLENVKLNATFNNTASSIRLGDTLKISLQIPDTLISNTTKINVVNLQKGQFYARFSKVDTINNRAIFIKPPIYWTTDGTINQMNSFSFEFSNRIKPYSLKINFKPVEKGIYHVEVASQPGDLAVNNKYEARLVIDFDVPDRHINLAAPFYGQAWANESMTRQPGTFVFRVN